jgi:hypothetical protein
MCVDKAVAAQVDGLAWLPGRVFTLDVQHPAGSEKQRLHGESAHASRASRFLQESLGRDDEDGADRIVRKE